MSLDGQILIALIEELLVDALHNQIASHNDTTEASSHLGSNGTAVTMANRHTDPPTQDLTTGLRELDGQFNHSLDCFLGWSNESPYTPGDRFTVEESVAADWRCYLASSGSSSLRSRSVESAA
jgi:hypothetical protein